MFIYPKHFFQANREVREDKMMKYAANTCCKLISSTYQTSSNNINHNFLQDMSSHQQNQ